MLIATRDHDPHARPVHFGAATPPRTMMSRFTGGVQLLGSLVGIPLALVGGYSTYHANFSPEAKCQALRGNIIAMLDKKADASTLRMLVHRDVVTFERDCGGVDAEAATAFKTLLVAEKTPALRGTTEARVRHEAPPKVEKAERVEKPAKPAVVEKTVAKADTKTETKVEAKAEAKREAKVEAKAEPASKPVVAAPKAEPKPAPEKAVEAVAEKPIEEPKPVAVAAAHPDTAGIDAAWVASVRDALRESASQPPAAEAASDAVPNLAAPINITPEPQAENNVAADATPERRGELVPPADVGPAPRALAPRPPAPIPNAN